MSISESMKSSLIVVSMNLKNNTQCQGLTSFVTKPINQEKSLFHIFCYISVCYLTYCHHTLPLINPILENANFAFQFNALVVYLGGKNEIVVIYFINHYAWQYMVSQLLMLKGLFSCLSLFMWLYFEQRLSLDQN